MLISAFCTPEWGSGPGDRTQLPTHPEASLEDVYKNAACNRMFSFQCYVFICLETKYL